MKLSLDSPVFDSGNRAADLLTAGFLWVLLCLPVITAGPASCALYYTVVKVVRKKRETVGKAFFHSFRENLKQGMTVTALLLLYGGALAVCAMLYGNAGGQKGLMILAIVILAVPFAAVLPWIFPVISRFRAGLTRQLQYAVYLAVRHFRVTIALQLLLAAVVLSVILLPFLLLLLPGIYAYLSSLMIEKVFRIYTEKEREKYEDPDELPWYLE